MNGLIIFVSLVLIIQVIIFFVVRNKKKREKQNSMMEKYNIKSSSDAFRLIQDMSIPAEDRKRIEALYHGKEEI